MRTHPKARGAIITPRIRRCVTESLSVLVLALSIYPAKSKRVRDVVHQVVERFLCGADKFLILWCSRHKPRCYCREPASTRRSAAPFGIETRRITFHDRRALASYMRAHSETVSR